MPTIERDEKNRISNFELRVDGDDAGGVKWRVCTRCLRDLCVRCQGPGQGTGEERGMSRISDRPKISDPETLMPSDYEGESASPGSNLSR